MREFAANVISVVIEARINDTSTLNYVVNSLSREETDPNAKLYKAIRYLYAVHENTKLLKAFSSCNIVIIGQAVEQYYKDAEYNYYDERIRKPDTKNNPEYKEAVLQDYSKEMNKWLDENLEQYQKVREEKGFLGENKYFVNSVKPGGPIDIKEPIIWKERFGTDQPEVFMYNGEKQAPADLGNILYGYMGADCPYYPDELLYLMGGLVQVYKNDDLAHVCAVLALPYYGDAKEDKDATRFGIELYRNRNGKN